MMIILGSWCSRNQIWHQAPTLPRPAPTRRGARDRSHSRIAATASRSAASLASRPKLSRWHSPIRWTVWCQSKL